MLILFYHKSVRSPILAEITIALSLRYENAQFKTISIQYLFVTTTTYYGVGNVC